ncbi:MAG: extracellular solute-binding protein [Chloroflexi bacterium]|nr:extracellular solute-binding protein [Chloroflexota bacterium]
MNKKYYVVLVGLLAVAIACSPAPASPSPAPAPAGKGGLPAVKAAWEVQWEKTVAEGKKEGVVVVYTALASTTVDVLRKAFTGKFGINLEYVVGRGPELLARVKAQRVAGIYTADVLVGGSSTTLIHKEPGHLTPLEPALILPEVRDPKGWLDGKLFFFDQDGSAMGTLAHPIINWIVNTDIARPEEAASYKHLLDPRWKGKMILFDPTTTGSGNAFIGTAAWEMMGEDYIRALARQEPVITRDARLHMESVARGKYPIGLAPTREEYFYFKKAGAPVTSVMPPEGTAVTTSNGGLALFNKPPNPNAARVFLNWLLSKEGQTTLSKDLGVPSRRLDVPRDHVSPDSLLPPGIKYVLTDTEDAVRLRTERQALARDIFGIR